MNFVDTIAAKRDRIVNTKEQLQFLASGAADGSIPDYQLSAWLMAAYMNGLNPQETADLTLAMARSGERLDLTGLPRPWLDKHSTGGVGDKTTLVVLPILAACGVTMVKMSGRGLGITGGTIDKLESVPGFRTDLTPEELVGQARRIGIALSGQTPRLAPADKALYALRDVTGTVASIPLITASILSKKIAGGAETVVLDVKCGCGAFMKTLPEAEALARSLVDTGKLCGLKVSALITDMDQPLGMAVGNAMEVKEALAVLHPETFETYISGKAASETGMTRFVQLCVHLAGHALESVDKGDSSTVVDAVMSGRAKQKALEWFVAQGVSEDDFHNVKWQSPAVTEPLIYDGPDRWITKIRADLVGEVVIGLGGGRQRKDDKIDARVGVLVSRAVGDRVTSGTLLFDIFGATNEAVELARTKLLAAVEFSPQPVKPAKPILKTIE